MARQNVNVKGTNKTPITSQHTCMLGRVGVQCNGVTCFYPTALEGCRGIVFTHGVRIDGPAGVLSGGRVFGRREKVCPGCISETVSCRKLILGRDIGLGGVGVQRHSLTLI